MTNIEDGIYFRMPAETYHAIPRLSASSIQKLLVSPATFWAGSWLDPDAAAFDEEATKAQILGKAYHVARLEPHLFDGLYVRELAKDEMPEGTLFTGTEMGKALEEMGLKKTGSVSEQSERLVEGGFDESKLWHMQLAQWDAARDGRAPIAAKYFDDIKRDMERIRSSTQVADLLEGGAAEVSIFWTDDKGMKLKARLDYLQHRGWCDYKSFANPAGKHLEQCIADAFIYSRYHVQATHYRDAIEMVRTGQLSIIGEVEDHERELIEAVQLADELACWYIFQEKGGVPNLLAKRLKFFEVPINTIAQDAIAKSDEHRQRVHDLTQTPSLWFVRAQREIRKAKRLFRTYSEVYAPGDPWLPFNPVGELSDMDFSSFWLDAEIRE